MKLQADLIERALRVGLRPPPSVPLRVGTRVEIRKETASTNDDVLQRGIAGEAEGLAEFAEAQTAGRGRNGNVWTAPAGENLMFSILLRPGFTLEFWPRLAHAAGLAVIRGVQPWSETQDLKLKWPNDVYADGKKLAGILVESRTMERGAFAVVGIGLNVNSRAESFPPELRTQLTSLRELQGGGGEIQRSEVAGSILAEMNRTYDLAGRDFSVLRREMEACSLLLDREISFRLEERWERGTVVGFGENGELRVRGTEEGEERLILSADHVRLV